MTMTEKLKSTVQIPNWVIILFFPIFVTFLSFLINVSVKAATIKERVDQHSIELSKKASQSDVDRIYITLDRIENKIDKLTTEH
jgi:hypothetical protein